MSEVPREEIYERCHAMYAELGITKEIWQDKTGYSIDQYYRWHSLDNPSSPDGRQMMHCYTVLDMSIMHAWYGIGPVRLSENIHNWERMRDTIGNIMEYYSQPNFEMLRQHWKEHEEMLSTMRALKAEHIDKKSISQNELEAMVVELSANVKILMQRTKE